MFLHIKKSAAKKQVRCHLQGRIRRIPRLRCFSWNGGLPRAEAKKAVKTYIKAVVKVAMITGDYKKTAAAISSTVLIAIG